MCYGLLCEVFQKLGKIQPRGCFHFQKLPQSLALSPQGRKGKKYFSLLCHSCEGRNLWKGKNPIQEKCHFISILGL